MEPLKEHSKGIREIIKVLDKRHYRDVDVDDSFSSLLLESYLEQLDPTKTYFLASDISEFQAWETSLDDELKAGDLDHVFAIYNRFRTRISERLAANITLLESDYSFDFTIEETLPLDPDARQWPATTEQADDFWRKRVKDSLLRLLLSDKEVEAARELLIKRYKNQQSLISQQSADDSFELYANAVAGIYDPHTSYLSPRTLENFQISMSLSLEGIGAVLQREDELTKVVSVVPGGPADKQGSLAPGDKIISVAQDDDGETVDVIGWRLDDVVELIRGKKGTEVRLGVMSGKTEVSDETQEISIIRDKVKLEGQAAKKQVITLPGSRKNGGEEVRVGVITLPAFYMDFEAYRRGDKDYKSTTRDVFKLLNELREEEVNGVILDLRNNGGGSLYEATALTDLFIDPGPVVQIKHASQRVSRDQVARQSAMYNGPLLVLINRLSASASEIFAGVIQDYGRGLVVGSQSFGKGTVQVLTPLDSGQLKLTESKFYRVSGESTQHRGVVPDISFPSLYDVEEIGESSQDFALPWDHIHAAPHLRYDAVSPLLADLEQRHQSRVTTDFDWGLMLEELELIEKNRAIKEISLNREQRILLKSERENTLMTLANKRRSAKGEAAYDTVEAWREAAEKDEEESAENKADEDEDEEFDPASDPQLKESSYILLDYITLAREFNWNRQIAARIKAERK
ncbi:MAG: carboxy terminal-processing peptidase [Porticoccaceae bacterium]